MIKKAVFIVIVFALIGGCTNKLSLLAPYKESVSVYGLLNQDEPIQYIRIERVFLGAESAYTMAQTQDSVYFTSGELKVTLQRWNKYTNAQVSVDVPASSNLEIILTDTLLQAAAGIFNQNERVYKTNHKLHSDTNCVYKLIIHNNKTGKEFTSQTGLIAPFQLLPSSGGNQNDIRPNYQINFSPINIVPGNGGLNHCYYGSPINSGVCGLTMRFFYTENNSGVISRNYLDIGLGTNYPAQSLGGEKQEFDYTGFTILNQLALSIPGSSSVTRTADSIEYVLNAAGQTLALYNQVNTSTSLSQSKANYSNINGGVGVFSCVNELKLKRLIAAVALDTIAGSHITCKLRFTNAVGSTVVCH